jgi:hypothetical protein
MRQRLEATSAARFHNESPRREGAVRILVVDASTSCRMTIAGAEGASDSGGRLEVVRTTSAELEHHTSDSWDLMITHVHECRVDRAAFAPEIPSRNGLINRLFRRKKLSHEERKERQVTRTVVLAEIQREIGIALSAVEMGDFDTIGEIAMRIKDDGANYNFAKLSGLGAALYDTVPSRDIRTARNIAQKLMTYMGKAIGSYHA